MTTPAELARKRLVRVLSYFASIIALIIFVNSPGPGIVLGALLGEPAGLQISEALTGFTRDLFLLLLVSLYFEWARSRGIDESIDDIRSRLTVLDNSVREYLPSSLQTAIRQSIPTEEVLASGLPRSLRTISPTVTAAAQVTLKHASLENVTVKITLERKIAGEGPGVRSVLTASTDVKDILVAVTRQSIQADLLAAHSRELFSVIALDSGAHNAQSARLDEHKIYYRNETDAFIEADLAHLDVGTVRELVSLPPGVSESNVDFYRVQLPDLSGDRRTIRTDFRYRMGAESRFYAWRADRPMFVRQLSVDATDLVAGSHRDVRFSYFLPNQDQFLDEDSGSGMDRRVDSWLLDGHGLVAVWG